MRIVDMTKEKFTSEVCEQYILFREEIVRQYEQKKLLLEDPLIYIHLTKRFRERGYDYTRTFNFDDDLENPLGQRCLYFVHNSKSNELISVTQFFPAGGDEREKTWVELMAIYRILMDRMSRPVEDLLLQCENTYLRSYNKNHGIPVMKIRAKSEPGDPLLNPLLLIGYQIETTTHSFQIPISRLVTKITGDKNLDIRAQSIREVDMTSNLAKNLGEMIDKWLQIQEKIHPEDLQQNVLKENIFEQFKTIREDEERILAGGILLMFFETNDPVPAGFCFSFRSKKEISILQFLIVGPQRTKRVKSTLQAFIKYFRFDDGRDIKLILKTSAWDTEMTRTLESLGFSLAKVVYDLTKDGPDRDKVVFDTYASQILGV